MGNGTRVSGTACGTLRAMLANGASESSGTVDVSAADARPVWMARSQSEMKAGRQALEAVARVPGPLPPLRCASVGLARGRSGTRVVLGLEGSKPSQNLPVAPNSQDGFAAAIVDKATLHTVDDPEFPQLARRRTRSDFFDSWLA